ncbi:MAG: tetratricopeptide repeat protein [Acidobacteriota bacterium]|nr:tetratricopeptide repeat protein [Acidobacteriota bacterium]MDH3784360.1 tetratricopeptide repeat protein [Acidobacteriota bacterium]
MNRTLIILLIAMGLAVTALHAERLPEVTVDYPVDGSIFPPDIVAPTFLWHDPTDADRWELEVSFAEGAPFVLVVAGDPPPRGEIDPRCLGPTNEVYEPTAYQASAHSWRPNRGDWKSIQDRSSGAPARITLTGFRDGASEHAVSRGAVGLTTSTDPVGAPIFYRDVPLMPSKGEKGVIKPLAKGAIPLIDWRLRSVALDSSRIVLRDMPTCANCHSFSADGQTMGMDVDGPEGDKGAYAIAKVEPEVVIDDAQVMTWNAFPGKPEGLNSLGFLSRISPDGRYSISTLNEAIFVRNFTDFRFSQVFFPTRGILAVYDTQTGEVRALPGADDEDYVHCNAVWAPDGKTIVFSRAPAMDPYDNSKPLATFSGDPNETQLKYDLYRIPFNDGRGGTAKPIAGAGANGMSNSFPKVSPDGKWIVWVKAKNGQLMRPDSRLWIAPFEGGQAREMRCNTSRMNSWHSFSPNSRWMVFSSKARSPYTQMYLTHIDEDGNDSPPILIENSTAANRAVNLPEFVNTSYDNFVSISVPAVDHYRYFARGNELQRSGQLQEAVEQFEMALEGDAETWRVNDWRIHDSMSKTLLQLGDRERALEHARDSLRLNPYNSEMQANAGYLLFELGEPGAALEKIDIALKLSPGDARLYLNRGTMRLQLQDDAGAEADFSESIRRSRNYADPYVARGIVRRQLGDDVGARSDLDKAIEIRPEDPTPWYFRALIREAAADLAGAIADVEQAASRVNEGWPHQNELRELERRLRDRVEARD